MNDEDKKKQRLDQITREILEHILKEHEGLSDWEYAYIISALYNACFAKLFFNDCGENIEDDHIKAFIKHIFFSQGESLKKTILTTLEKLQKRQFQR